MLILALGYSAVTTAQTDLQPPVKTEAGLEFGSPTDSAGEPIF